MSWLEVSLTVNGELAEAVADVLARYAPGGVTTEQAVTYNDLEDTGTPIGPITVRAYLAVNEGLEETRQRLEESLFYLGSIQALPRPTFTPVADQDWMEAWKERYRPIPIGRRLIIVPAWLESPDVSRIPIKIDPGMAFGTGTHPTTQLCLEYLEEIVDRSAGTRRDGLPSDPHQPVKVLDLGCGSGILSIGALKLGSSFALGVDIDEAAIHASRENARANGIRPETFALGVGSVAELLKGEFPLRSAPLVLANILAPVLISLFGVGMARLVEPGGALILSGILAEQEQPVVEAARASGMRLSGRKQIEDWVALECRH